MLYIVAAVAILGAVAVPASASFEGESVTVDKGKIVLIFGDSSLASPPDSILSSSDLYSQFVIDTCTRSTGVPVTVGDLPGVLYELRPEDHGSHAIVGYAEETAVPAITSTAEDPCCICGIVSPDGGLKGCAAFGAACCCRATIAVSGHINCECQGGLGCDDIISGAPATLDAPPEIVSQPSALFVIHVGVEGFG